MQVEHEPLDRRGTERRPGGRAASPVSRALRLVLGVALGVTMTLMLAAPAGASSAGQQWAMCSGGGHSYQGRVHWTSGGQVHAIEFRNATRRVETLGIQQRASHDPTGTWPGWYTFRWSGVHNRESAFTINSNYHRRNFSDGRPMWGWHMNSGHRTRYDVRIAVYPTGTSSAPACYIEFQSNAYDFTSVK